MSYDTLRVERVLLSILAILMVFNPIGLSTGNDQICRLILLQVRFIRWLDHFFEGVGKFFLSLDFEFIHGVSCSSLGYRHFLSEFGHALVKCSPSQ